MSFFTICGNHNCPEFVHAVFVAHYLQDHLPSFQYKKIEKAHKHWKKFLEELNKDNKWNVFKSPVIYKQISVWGGKKYLIGSLSDFWEYCYCYYGLESLIPKCDLIKLAEDNVMFFNEKTKKTKFEKKNVRVISIMGACEPIVYALIDEIIQIPNLTQEDGVIIKLHDRSDHNHKNSIEDILAYYKTVCQSHRQSSVVSVENFERHAIQDSDILIHVEDFSRRVLEEKDNWLQRCFLRMSYLADWINIHAKRSLKVILCNNGPLCFMGSLLIEFCTILHVANIVAVTANEGLSTLGVISEMVNIPVANLSAPPVWGFVGMNQFVDEESIIYKADVYRPYQRSVNASPDSTLPAGTVKTEFRLLRHKVEGMHTEIEDAVERKKVGSRDIRIESFQIDNHGLLLDVLEGIGFGGVMKWLATTQIHMEVCLQRKAQLAKLRALVSLIKLWFGPSECENVISLGVCSDGNFGIPAGLMFSQPVALDPTNKWRPVKDFPLINEKLKEKIALLAEESSQLVQTYLDASSKEQEMWSKSVMWKY